MSEIEQYNHIPNIDMINLDYNPTITSPSSPFEISFAQTRESLMDVENYRNFLKNAESRFRNSQFYKHYKGHLMGIGLDHSQLSGNITAEMVGDRNLEMHHFPIGLFSAELIICEHILNTLNMITTFDLVTLLKQEHKNNNIGLCFLTSTEHQLFHNTEGIYISPRMIIGQWWKLLEKYPLGLTQDIAFKLLFWIKDAIDNGDASDDSGLLDVRDKILEWSQNNNQIR